MKSEDTLNQAVTLSNISLAYQELGEWGEAERTINQSMQITENFGLIALSQKML
mgnify:CR=1 FL=1